MKSKMTPLGGKYTGIYTFKLGTEHRFRVNFSAVIHGKRRWIRRTCKTLPEAVETLTTLKAQHHLGNLPQAQSEKVRLGQMIDLLRAKQKRNRAPEGSLLYLQEIEDFFGRDLLVEALDEHWVSHFSEHLDKQKCKGTRKGLLGNKSKDHRLVMLRQLLNLAKKKGVIRVIPEVRLYRRYGKRDYSLDLPSFCRFAAVMPGPPNPHQAMMWMAFYTGQRKSDLLKMTWSQIKVTGQDWSLLRYRSSKNDRDLAIPIPKELTAALDALVPYRIPNNPWIFPNPRTHRPYTDLRKSLERASKIVGINPPVTLHMIRHLAADCAMMATGDRERTRQYMGWHSTAMVDIYTHGYTRAGDTTSKIAELVKDELEKE